MLLLPQFITSKLEALFKEERSKKLLANVLSSFLVKIFSMAITLTLIPVSLKFTDENTYGVWLTLASVITWFNLFDLGLSNGLMNKLSEAFAKGEIQSARKYISTTYVFLFLIIFTGSLVFIPAGSLINWNSVFNTRINSTELQTAIGITYASFCLTFILKPLNDLLKAKQKHFVLSIIQASGNLIALLLIVYFGDYSNSKFIFLCLALGFSYPFALLIASIIFYFTTYNNLFPKIRLASKDHLKGIFSLSSKFFIIQLSVVAILSSNNFLISNFVDNSSVTYYNIAYRLFSIITIFQVMIMTPLWPAFTNAYTLKDFTWIRSAISRSNKLNFLLCIPLIIMFLICDQIYYHWIGPEIKIPFEVNLLLMIFVAISIFKETYVSLINGVGKLNLQVSFSIVSIILQVPLAYFLAKVCGLGISGILLLNIFWALIGFVLWKIQYSIVMNSPSTKKIWN